MTPAERARLAAHRVYQERGLTPESLERQARAGEDLADALLELDQQGQLDASRPSDRAPIVVQLRGQDARHPRVTRDAPTKTKPKETNKRRSLPWRAYGRARLLRAPSLGSAIVACILASPFYAISWSLRLIRLFVR
jgi:hypothetical protein